MTKPVLLRRQIGWHKGTVGFTRIGTIVKSHGIRGEVKVMPITDDETLLFEQEQLIIDEGNRQQVLTVDKSRWIGRCWLIQFQEIRDRDAADSLKGAGVCVEDGLLRPLADEEFFIHDLIGAEVVSTAGDYLGVVCGFFLAGTQGVCEVRAESGTFMFPASKEVLREIDPGRRVIVNLVPGLKELNR